MIYVLDTDSVIFLTRSLKKKEGSSTYDKAQRLLEKIREKQGTGASVCISAITKAELEFGAAICDDPEKERRAIDKILAPFEKHAFDAEKCASFYGRIRAELEREGESIGAMDMLIAAHALALDAHLISNNIKFELKKLSLITKI